MVPWCSYYRPLECLYKRFFHLDNFVNCNTVMSSQFLVKIFRKHAFMKTNLKQTSITSHSL